MVTIELGEKLLLKKKKYIKASIMCIMYNGEHCNKHVIISKYMSFSNECLTFEWRKKLFINAKNLKSVLYWWTYLQYYTYIQPRYIITGENRSTIAEGKQAGALTQHILINAHEPFLKEDSRQK